MNYDLVRGLYDALDELADDLTCRVIVLTGAGPRVLRRPRPDRRREPAVDARAWAARRRA